MSPNDEIIKGKRDPMHPWREIEGVVGQKSMQPEINDLSLIEIVAERTYIEIWHGLRFKHDLRPLDNLILGLIIAVSKGPLKYCSMSQLTISKLFNVTVPPVAKALKRLHLHKDGLIRKIGVTRVGTDKWVPTDRVVQEVEYFRKLLERNRVKNKQRKLGQP